MRASRKLKQLVNDVEELVAELGDDQRPEVQALRDRVEEAIDSTRQSVAARGRRVAARAGAIAGSLDTYITRHPRLAFVSGVALASLVGYLLGASSRPVDDV